MAQRNGGISYEPCTLVYTLLENNENFSFDDMYLYLRSIHTFMVEEIKPFPESNSVQVKLGYQASVINAKRKLGKKNYIALTKLSNFVKPHEISRLEVIRAKLGVNYDADDAPSTSAPRRRYASKLQRPKPYSLSGRKVPSEEDLLPNGSADQDSE